MLYKLTLANVNFGHLMPEEDQALARGNKFCVADGITRDPSSPAVFSYQDMRIILKKYPNPSPATLAAKTFCRAFIKALEAGSNMRRAFIVGNREIAILNKRYIKKTDYLVNDLYGCVASGGQIKNGRLLWGAITDCGIIIYDKKGKIKFQTPDWMKPFENYMNKKNLDWTQPETRRLIRSQYRNNPKKIVNGESVGYGGLTGEKTAEKFMHFGSEKLTPGDMIVFYSDGFAATVTHRGFFKAMKQDGKKLGWGIEKFSNRLEKLDHEKYGRERTILATVYNV